jgi:hypothetical protein
MQRLGVRIASSDLQMPDLLSTVKLRLLAAAALAALCVLRLHAPGSEHKSWHEHRVAERVRAHFDVPTIASYFDNEGQVVGREDA